MYRCEVCSSVTAPGIRLNKLVVETRLVDYPPRPKVHFKPGDDGGKGKWIDDPGGRGHEVVREIDVCPNCVVKPRALDHDGDRAPSVVTAV